ncbi:MAG: hypothetical protein RR246_01270 [Clostridia bacterium]
MITVEQILWSFFIGVAFASVYIYYTKHVLGKFVRLLLGLDAFDIDNAVTLEAIKMDKNIFVKFALREGSSFSETVMCENGKYYVPEKNLDKAEKKYSDDGTTLFIILLILLVLLFVALVSVYVIPNLIDMIT